MKAAAARRFVMGLASCALLIGAPLTSTAQLVDHFLCYKAKRTKGSGKFSPVVALPLADRFESGDFDVKKPRELCVPADKNGEGIVDADTHLESYQVKAVKGAPKHQRLTDFRVVDQFGELFLGTTKPDSLYVPTAKDLVLPVPAPPDPGLHAVDHFKCYKVKKPKGFQTITGVSVVDQFAQPKLYDLKKPARLCAPVDKDGEGIKEENSFLVCYQAKPAKGEPKHVPVVGAHLHNQFGQEQVDTKKESLLCVPTLAVQGCGDGLVNELGEQCDDGNEDDGDGCSSTCTAELPFTLKIANMNILHNVTPGAPGFDDIFDRLRVLADEIAAVDPDIVTFQEVVLGSAMSFLTGDLVARYGLEYFSAQYGVVTGNAVISKWPLSLEETAQLPSVDEVPVFPDRRFAGRIVVWSPVGPIDVYAMHMCAGSIGCTMPDRTVQTEHFVQFVADTHTSGHPAIVGADFNAHTGTAPDGNPVNDPPIDVMQLAGWTTLFDGFDAPCDAPTDRSGCTSGIGDLAMLDDTTTRRIDDIMTVPAAEPVFSGAISEATETGPTARFAGVPFVDPNPQCHFDPRLPCPGGSGCPAGAACNANEFCVRQPPIGCATNADCPGDIAPEACRTTLWVSDHIGVQSTIELTSIP